MISCFHGLFIRKYIRKRLLENYEDLGIYSDFDSHEMMGNAQKAAMKDIEDSGEEFKPLGKSKFEKKLNINDMMADLERQNLDLPNDKKAVNKIQNALDVKKAHEKKFGKGSMNETQEWLDGDENVDLKETLKKNIEPITNLLAPGIAFFIKEIKDSNNIEKGPYADVKIQDKTYKVWLMEGDELYIENFPINNTAEPEIIPGFIGNQEEIADVINERYSILANMNEDKIRKFINNSLNEKYYFPTQDDITKKLKKLESEKQDKSGKELSDIEDKIKYLKKNLKENSNVNPNTKIDRPKDAEGQPITLKARVESLDTKSIGRVVRFGVDDNGKLTVHVSWISDFGKEVPKSIVYPDKIVVRDDARIVREVELTDEDSLEFRHIAGQREKSRNGVPLGQHAPHSQKALKDEGAGIGLDIKKGMNVKPTSKK
jgi:hypothetical protein